MDDLQARNKRIAFGIVIVVVGMIALSFASVPLYSLFCRMTGYGGTTQVAKAAPHDVRDRTITVSFDARVDPGLPWDFKPEKHSIDIKVGQQGMIVFHATNLSARTTVGTALYNVTPDKAGPYFTKTQCFCFAEQVLTGGKSAQFPVLFYIDPKIMDNPDMNDVSDITLSYTFFPADSKNFEKAMNALGQEIKQ